MTNRPARITQAEIQRAIRTARKEGASAVEVKIEGETTVRIPLVLDTPLTSGVSELDAWKAKHAR
jgi:hypothetical protein